MDESKRVPVIIRPYTRTLLNGGPQVAWMPQAKPGRKPRWIGITDKALASQFGGESSSPAETRG